LPQGLIEGQSRLSIADPFTAMERPSLKFQMGVIGLAEVHDNYFRLRAGLVENSSSLWRGKIRQVLSECLPGSVAASESIWQAIEILQPFEQPHRWEVFDEKGKLICRLYE
jgi:hypothetical protein